jgi:hypothetical protein
MKISNKITFTLLLFLLFACKTENSKEKNNSIKVESEKIKLDKKNKLTNIEVLFDEKNFKTDVELNLLKELGLGMCNPNEKDLSNFKNPACDAKFFKFFTFKVNQPLKNSFILLVKAMVHDFPLRRVFVFQRINNKLVKVNGFIANLIGKRKSKTMNEDLILRFSDQDQNHFNCVYSWKNNHYEYVKVEAINDSPIKENFQDSMNLEIQKVIEMNRMHF